MGDDKPSYFIAGCMNKKKEFELPSSEDGEYIWRVTKADGRIMVHCNGEEVINVPYADSAKVACREMWSEDTEAIEFLEEDNASDGYRARRTRGGNGKRKRKRGKGKRKGKKKGDKSKDGTMEKGDEDQVEEVTMTTGIAVHGTETTGATEYTYTYTYGSTEPTEGPADMMVPERSSVIEFDWEETPLEIRTNSLLGSGDQIKVRFLTEEGSPAGNLKIKFDDNASYFITDCMNKKKGFKLPSSEDGEYIWRVTKADGRIIVHCNGEEVINVSYADSAKAACREMWSKDTEAIEFMEEDNASDGYRARRTRGGKGKRKGGMGKRKGKKKGDKSKNGTDRMA